MNVLCAIGIQGGPEVVRRVLQVIGLEHDLYLLHVIDVGPRHALEQFLHGPGSFRRLRHSGPPVPPLAHPPSPPGRDRVLDDAERAAGAATLDEARHEAERAGVRYHAEMQPGRPEQVIIESARSWDCQLIAIQASEGSQGRPHLGPGSVGHTARFVLDHAHCDVLLLRTP